MSTPDSSSSAHPKPDQHRRGFPTKLPAPPTGHSAAHTSVPGSVQKPLQRLESCGHRQQSLATHLEREFLGRTGVSRPPGEPNTHWAHPGQAGQAVPEGAAGSGGYSECPEVLPPARVCSKQVVCPGARPRVRGPGDGAQLPGQGGQRQGWDTEASASYPSPQWEGKFWDPMCHQDVFQGGAPKGNQGAIRKGEWVRGRQPQFTTLPAAVSSGKGVPPHGLVPPCCEPASPSSPWEPAPLTVFPSRVSMRNSPCHPLPSPAGHFFSRGPFLLFCPPDLKDPSNKDPLVWKPIFLAKLKSPPPTTLNPLETEVRRSPWSQGAAILGKPLR